MDDAIYIELIAKYLSGNITPEEREQLMAWVEEVPANRSFFEEMIQLWSISGRYKAPFDTNSNYAWDTLEERLFGGGGATIEEMNPSSDKTSTKIVRLSIKKVILRAAAVILAAIAVSVWLFSDFGKGQDQMVVIETSQKERKQLELPDGSTIWLNENTRLSYDQNFDERVVQLEGEAFFDVAHQQGKTFTILSGGAATTVLGTTFNVRAYPGEARIEVTVATGKVALKKADIPQEQVLLEAGKSGVFDKQTAEVRVIENQISNADAWKTQRLEFDSTLMRDVIPAVERFYGVNIELANEDLLDCPLTSSTGPEFEDFEATLNFMGKFQMTKHDNVYVITGPGCK